MSDEFDPSDSTGGQAASETSTSVESPGARLREVRERHDLTLGQVALSLHVNEDLLESLENDDYGKLGAPIFVKGHLRNYAKLLELDAAELIRMYEQHHQPVDPALDNRVPDGPRMEQRGSGAWLRWLGTILLLILLVVLAGWWYYRQEALPAGVSVESRNPVELLADRQPEVSDTESGLGPDGVAEEGAPNGRGEESGERAGIETGSAGSEIDDAGTAGSGEGQSTEPVTSDAEGLADEAPVKSDVPEAAEAETGDTVADPALLTERRIVLEFSGESWVEIYDHQDQPLLYDLKAAGSRQTLEVVGPVRLFLGNAPEVSITVDGEILDVGRFTRRDNTARFRIPPER